ncbi:GTP-binding protein [Tenacibaculum sp. C7A-26P2]|uniref:GTP-binding protein n=1 Tax=Tenacibaculum sp. C7A-26P2 TaxID=3447504 RepID=UPI003F837B39
MAFLKNQKQIESNWDIEIGDRKNRLVFIGQNINKEKISANLEHCLTMLDKLNKDT